MNPDRAGSQPLGTIVLRSSNRKIRIDWMQRQALELRRPKSRVVEGNEVVAAVGGLPNSAIISAVYEVRVRRSEFNYVSVSMRNRIVRDERSRRSIKRSRLLPRARNT